MKARTVCFTAPKKLEIRERELIMGPDDILVKSNMFSICGTDKNYYLGKLPRGTKIKDPGNSKGEVHRSYPLLMGHEGGGIVVDVGAQVKNIKVGDHVTSMGWNNCMGDYWVGQNRPDGHGVILVQKGLSMETAALGDAVTCAVYAGMISGVQLGDVVAIVGCGFAGQTIAQIAKKKGAKTVICIDLVEPKLALAKKLGADITLNPKKDDIYARIMDITGGYGVDIAIEAAGLSETLQLCTDILKHGGILGIYSWILDPVNLIVDRWHNDGFEIRTLAIMHQIMLDRIWWINKTLQVVADGLVDIDSLLTHKFAFSDVQKAFDTVCNDDTACKVAVVF